MNPQTFQDFSGEGSHLPAITCVGLGSMKMEQNEFVIHNEKYFANSYENGKVSYVF